MIPLFPGFLPLSVAIADEYQHYVASYPPYADFNLTNRVCWNLDGSAAVSQLNGNLVLRLPDYAHSGVRTTLLGSNLLEQTIATLLAHAESKARLELMPEHVISRLTDKASWRVIEDVDNNDHVVSMPQLADMEGSALRHYRRAVRMFARRYDTTSAFHKLDLTCQQTQEAILRIFLKRENDKQWNDPKYELMALHRLLSLHEHFRLTCYGISVQGILRAFIICEPMNTTWVIGHFWKADTSFTGIYSYLMHRIASHLHKQGVEYMNTQQDLGINGLRAFKQSLSPVMHLRKYTLCQNATQPHSALQPETLPQ